MTDITINRLTDRAKSVILSLSSDITDSSSKTTKSTKSKLLQASDFSKIFTTSKSVLESIVKSGGIGSLLLKQNPDLNFSTNTKIDIHQLVEKAFYFSASLKHLYVGTEHLLLALLDITSSPALEDVKKQLLRINVFPNSTISLENEPSTPILEAFGVNLNKRLSQNSDYNPVYREEMQSLLAVLLKKEGANALIVGDAGVGKQTLVDLLTKKIINFDVPTALLDHQVIEFDALPFIASISGREGFESALTAFLEDLDKIGNVILFIKDLQSLFVGTNGGLAVPFVFSMMRSYLSSAGISIIGTMNSDFHSRIQNENAQFFDEFEVINLDEPDEATTLNILKSKVLSLSGFHNIEISEEVLKYAYVKAKTSIKDISFPQKAISLLDHACTMLLIKKDLVSKTYKRLFDKKLDLSDKFNAQLSGGFFSDAFKTQKLLTKLDQQLEDYKKKFFKNKKFILSVSEIDESLLELGYENDDKEESVDLEALRGLSLKIKQKIIGQDSAVDTVSKALIRSKLGLRSRKRPLGNFLFLGPTGVGKTELAKVLSESIFDENSLIRLDMSDFSEKHTVARLVGAPPGYVGFGEGGELTSKIDSNPNSLVLFDEIEKAHPDVLNILLQIMDEGELSDAKGNRFDFSKSIVILTSNLGSDIVYKKEIGFIDGSKPSKADNQVEDRLKDNLKKIMKPELINRFDEVVVFRRLDLQDQKKILDLLLAEVDATLKKQRVFVKVPINVRNQLLKLGYNEEYGARGLRRAVESNLLDPIADHLLKSTKRPVKLKISLDKKGKLIPTQI